MSLKHPPSFNPDDGDSYRSWKTDVEVWRLFTKDEKSKHGPALYLSLQGDAREAVREIEPADLAREDGFDSIIQLLDVVYLKDETTMAFCAFKAFVEYRRDSGQGYSKFLLEYNNKYREIKKYGMELADGVKAYFLLSAANLSAEHERLVRATSKLEFQDVSEKLQKVFGDYADGDDAGSDVLPVKSEECFFAQGKGRGSFSGGRGRGSFGRGGFGKRGGGRGSGNAARCFECDSTKHFVADCPHRSSSPQKCHNCQSTKHLIADCPHKVVEDANVTVHLTLVAGQADQQHVLLSNNVCKGILDSGCTKTVAGSAWLEEYLVTLTDEERASALESKKQNNTVYRFGDGKESKSNFEICLPARVWNKSVNILVDIVDNDIPLLISRPLMSELGLVIDTRKHEAVVDGKRHELILTKTGHYSVPLCPFVDENVRVVLHAENVANLSAKEKKAKALKLHRQFAHTSKERLTNLVKSSDCNDPEFIRCISEVCDECSFCNKYGVQKPRPVVALPKASRFNECVNMDLKELVKGKKWILHLIDASTRYTAAAIISSKRKNVVVEKFCKIWLAYFGAPRKVHSDCGGEFFNQVFTELNDRFGIETSTTPGESPWSNGQVERNNKTLFETFMKTLEDAKCGEETALAWAVCALNSLQNHSGFSPNQLVLGRNVSLPTILSANMPMMETQTSSDLVRENLNALHAARENFIKSENSDKIKKALRHNVRTYAEVHFSPGDKVFYKRRKDKRWQGPAKVLGKETNFVLIRHGAAFYRCHPCQLRMADTTKELENSVPSRPTPTRENRKPDDSSSSSDEEEIETEHTESETSERPPETHQESEDLTDLEIIPKLDVLIPNNASAVDHLDSNDEFDDPGIEELNDHTAEIKRDYSVHE